MMTSAVMDLPARIRELLTVEPAARAVLVDAQWTTWKQLDDYICQLDAVLTNAGIGRYAPVGVVVRNSLSCYQALVAMIATRRTVVCLSAFAPDSLLEKELPALDLAALAAGSPDIDRSAVSSADAPKLDLDQLQLSGQSAAWTPSPAVAVYMLTSGTTGTPTRVPLSYAAMAKSVADTRQHIHGSAAPPDIQVRQRPAIIHAPLFHVSGLYRLVDNLVAGRPVLLLPKFEPHRWAQAVHDYKVGADGVNPTALKMVLDANIEPDLLRSLRVVRCGTAPLPAETREAFEARFGIPILSSYGATEFAGEVAAWTLDDHQRLGNTKAGAVGRVHAAVGARIVDPATGGPVDGLGVLELRSPRVADGTWIRTNDLARLDADRFLWILGRADDVIIRGGFKIDPREVAQVIESHPAVREAAVAGIADERLGKVPVAGVVLFEGSVATDEDLQKWCRARMVAYKVPARFVLIDRLPRNDSLKIVRPSLEALLANRTREP